MPDDLRFERRLDPRPGRALPPEAPLAMPTQVIERGRARRRAGWLRRLLGATV